MAEALAVVPAVRAGEVTLRSATAADDEAAQQLSARAFSAADGAAPPVADDTDVATGPPVLRMVAEHQGRVVAVASATLRGQWFQGRRVMCAAVGGVAVGVEARGLGVGRALLAALLAAARDSGASTSALFPSTHRFYAAMGYGIGGRRPVFGLSTLALRGLSVPRLPGLSLRRATVQDAAVVAELVRRRAVRGNGFLDHLGPDGSGPENPSGVDSYVAEVDGVVRGWCALRRHPTADRHANYALVVEDLLADTTQLELLLWRLLVGDHPSALSAEAVVLPGSVIEHHLERLRTIVEDSSWMLRLVDVDAALAGRGYPPGLRAEVVLDVDDPRCPWNEGPRLLRIAEGTAEVRSAADSTPDAVIAAADLASMFSAHLDPLLARHQGRLWVAEDRIAHTLRAMFAGPPAVLARTF